MSPGQQAGPTLGPRSQLWRRGAGEQQVCPHPESPQLGPQSLSPGTGDMSTLPHPQQAFPVGTARHRARSRQVPGPGGILEIGVMKAKVGVRVLLLSVHHCVRPSCLPPESAPPRPRTCGCLGSHGTMSNLPKAEPPHGAEDHSSGVRPGLGPALLLYRRWDVRQLTWVTLRCLGSLTHITGALRGDPQWRPGRGSCSDSAVPSTVPTLGDLHPPLWNLTHRVVARWTLAALAS